jgi:hypothetical protein
MIISYIICIGPPEVDIQYIGPEGNISARGVAECRYIALGPDILYINRGGVQYMIYHSLN